MTDKKNIPHTILSRNLKILIAFTALLLFSCGRNTNSELPDISQANSIKLYFKGDFDQSGKQNIITKEISDVKHVEAVKELMNDDSFAYLYCTSTGSMSFYRDSELLYTMVFNTDEGQRHIACNFNGKVAAVKLSDANADFLKRFKTESDQLSTLKAILNNFINNKLSG